jgi:UDP-N-acetylmuramoyl-L-alanyl-D-glutamate--2,6-diaminopimelate ligase
VKLSELLKGVEGAEVRGSADREISGVAYDSRKVREGSLFVAVRGQAVDGHGYIAQAIDAGAAAVIGERVEPDSRATVVRVADSRRALADVAAAFYGHPARSLKLIGVTGTNGKTTFAFLMKHLCGRAMMPAGLIGTVRYEIGDRILPASRTTPESADLHEMLAGMRAAGCRAAVMEVSSHALALDRVRGLEFDVAAFTNLTQDHLDFHGTMEAYFAAKQRLFEGLVEGGRRRGMAVVNSDDRYGQKLVALMPRERVVTYGMGREADFRGADIRIDFSGTTFRLDARGRSFLVRLPLIGRFNVYNALAALASASALGLNLREAIAALADAPPVPGRLEEVPMKRRFKVFVDYAHTPDALANVMRTVRELSPRRVIAVFGCGGNRDRAKRPLMGGVVDELADWAVVTSDNPRKEEPSAILAEIVAGMPSGNHEVVEERQEAIARAIGMAGDRDIVVIAGKGHETYQEFADRTVPFDDVDVARRAAEDLAREPRE